MRSKIIERILENIPLKTMLKVDVEAFLLKKHGGTFFLPCDQDGEPLQQYVDENIKIFEENKELYQFLDETIQKWKENTLLKYIDECEKNIQIFKQNNMETSVLTTEAMLTAYKIILEKID